jgi:monoamine oxidase
VTANEQLLEADYAIVTVPLGVLQQDKIAFTPALPNRKQAAIRNLHMGVLNKVYLRFPDVFWDADTEVLGFIADDKGHWGEYINLYYYTEQPILLCFNAEQFGRDIELWSDEDIIIDAMRVLRRMYGSEIPDPNGYFITRWGQDPFSYGSYSAFGIGASPADCEALGEAVEEVLFFAGEATHPEYSATVHGALLSGYRAAEEVMTADE